MTARKAASQLDLNSKKIINLGTPSSANDAARKTEVDTAQAFAISRANHTGTQVAATISDFATVVRLNRLDQMTAPTGPVSMSSQKLTSLLDPTQAQDAATKAYVDSSVSGLASGLAFKGTVSVAVSSNVLISNPGTAVFDSQTLSNGEIVLLYGQTTGSQNGPYVFNGSSVGMTRATNWDSGPEAVVGSFWVVAKGSLAANFAIATNTSFTLGTDTLTLQFVGVAPVVSPPFEADLGDGSTTVFTCTHNFGTRAVLISVRRVASPYDEIDVYKSFPTVNTVTVEPDEVWSTGQYHVVISKA